MIDTQVHILDPGRFPYPAASQGYVPTEAETATADDVLAVLDAHAVRFAVAVQASVYGTDNRPVLDLVDANPARFRAIVVASREDVSALCRRNGVAGVRLNLLHFRGQDIDTAATVGRAAHREGAIVQVQASPDFLQPLLHALGDGPVILDHLGRADLSTPAAVAVVKRYAARPETFLKVSGHFRVPGAEKDGVPTDAAKDLIAAFAPDRLLWGSDYPFIAHAGPPPTYAQCLDYGRASLDLDAARETAAGLFGFAGG